MSVRVAGLFQSGSAFCLLVAFCAALAGCVSPRPSGQGGRALDEGTNQPATNQLAIHLVAEEVPWKAVVDGTVAPSGLKLMPKPIIADADLLAYNASNHTVTVTRAAARRMVEALDAKLQVPFVLLACGEPIYVGVLTTYLSSTSSGVPAILTDPLLSGRSSKARFTIDRAYPAAGFGRGEDPRGDTRVISAIERLFPHRVSAPGAHR